MPEKVVPHFLMLSTIGFRKTLARGCFEVSAELRWDREAFLQVRTRRRVAYPIVNSWPSKNIVVIKTKTNKGIIPICDNHRKQSFFFIAGAGKQIQFPINGTDTFKELANCNAIPGQYSAFVFWLIFFLK